MALWKAQFGILLTATLVVAALFTAVNTGMSHAQSGVATTSPHDLRTAHERVVFATVRVQSRSGIGSGWLLMQSGRPLVVTNRHVFETARRFEIHFYGGSGAQGAVVQAERMHGSHTIDLGILRLLSDPPATARPLRLRTDAEVVRGERVVLGGNPSAGDGRILPFQTAEGVVTGHVSGDHYSQCGPGRNCVVVDAASFRGSSGGPVVNFDGRLVGMLWGGPTQGATLGRSQTRLIVQNTSFAYLIHARTIADELRQLERR